jgi:hypothetical protein
MMFNKSSGLVEVTSGIVFDDTNGSPREQVDLHDIDEDEVPTVTMRTWKGNVPLGNFNNVSWLSAQHG